MKGWGWSWRARMVNNTVYHFVGSNGGWDIFEKEGTSEKGCVEIEDWGISVHFALLFQENSIYTLCFVFFSSNIYTTFKCKKFTITR